MTFALFRLIFSLLHLPYQTSIPYHPDLYYSYDLSMPQYLSSQCILREPLHFNLIICISLPQQDPSLVK